jgi:DNA adenine methylase
MKPLLRWAGSKRKLIPQLSEYWIDPQRRYIEPFAGSATVFFALQPATALLSDINPELVAFMTEVQTNAKAVYSEAIKIPPNSESYYAIRSLPSNKLSSVKRAARFYYLNRFCFNGIYRTNEKGMFNVPYSGSRTGTFPKLEEFLDSVEVLKRAKVLNSDFETTLLGNANANDFVYLDPPYAVGNRRVFRQYGPNSFGLEDLARLAKLLIELNCRGTKFVLSYAYCAEALKVFAGWPKRKVFAQRNVSGFAKHRRRAAELIISNIVL